MSVRHTLFGAGKTITFPAEEILKVRSVGDQSDLLFSVELERRHRRKSTLVRELRSRADADGITARIEKALGKVQG